MHKILNGMPSLQTSSNLNDRVAHADRASSGGVSVYFDDCKQVVLDAINGCSFALVCAAWLTERDIINELVRSECKVVITADVMHTRCQKLQDIEHLRVLGNSRGRRRPLMHSKFLVGFDDHQQPRFVLTGSFNYTAHASRNIENLVRIDDAAIASAYADEFNKIYAAGRRLVSRR